MPQRASSRASYHPPPWLLAPPTRGARPNVTATVQPSRPVTPRRTLIAPPPTSCCHICLRGVSEESPEDSLQAFTRRRNHVLAVLCSALRCVPCRAPCCALCCAQSCSQFGGAVLRAAQPGRPLSSDERGSARPARLIGFRQAPIGPDGYGRFGRRRGGAGRSEEARSAAVARVCVLLVSRPASLRRRAAAHMWVGRPPAAVIPIWESEAQWGRAGERQEELLTGRAAVYRSAARPGRGSLTD